jgi:3-phosphoshikimate 1-carboxyvinyltransferase
MTAQVMQAFTADRQSLVLRNDAQSFTITARSRPYHLAAKSGEYPIEPDASAASYFLALPLVTGGQLRLLGARDSGEGLQGDTAFADVLRAVGAEVRADGDGLTVTYAPGQRRVGLERDFKAISDTFLTLAAIAPLLQGRTRITGIAHTRKQETDRVAGMARELTRLGQHVIETEDALEIGPRPLRADEAIETYHDHRFAMSFGVLGCHDLRGNGGSWLAIRNPASCVKTFPHFFELLESLRQKSLAG